MSGLVELATGVFDLLVGVLDGLGESHRCAGRDALVEACLAEHRPEVIDGCGQGGDHGSARVLGGAAVDGGGGLGLFESIEEHGECSERDRYVADVADLMERDMEIGKDSP